MLMPTELSAQRARFGLYIKIFEVTNGDNEIGCKVLRKDGTCPNVKCVRYKPEPTTMTEDKKERR